MKMYENMDHGNILQRGIEEFLAMFVLALVGFGYLIACFSKTLAGGYYIFLMVGSLFLILLRKIRQKRFEKQKEKDVDKLMNILRCEDKE